MFPVAGIDEDADAIARAGQPDITVRVTTDEDDAEELSRIFSDPAVVRYSGGRSPTLEQVREGIRQHISEHYRDHGYGLLAAELRRLERLARVHAAVEGHHAARLLESVNGVPGVGNLHSDGLSGPMDFSDVPFMS